MAQNVHHLRAFTAQFIAGTICYLGIVQCSLAVLCEHIMWLFEHFIALLFENTVHLDICIVVLVVHFMVVSACAAVKFPPVTCSIYLAWKGC